MTCTLCRRDLDKAEFARDAYRERTGRRPNRCRQCDREIARVKTIISPTGKYADADHQAAYELAKRTCRAHAWGSAYYSRTEQNAALYRTADKHSAADRYAAELRLAETAERAAAERQAELQAAAELRKQKIREWRQRKTAPYPTA